ncbi:hypothetical protein G6F61_012105 [Rhizopus arrhizus]|nr:hypothetical protein G6F61_012105 [Rhizopus arrhizus]
MDIKGAKILSIPPIFKCSYWRQISEFEHKNSANRCAMAENPRIYPSWPELPVVPARIEYLKNSTRSSTKNIYDNGWRQYHRCVYRKLLFSIRLASVFRELYPDEMLLSLQPTIQAFFAAKRRSEVRIPTIQQLETWDTNKMTVFILLSWADSNTLTLTDLQLKTIALLCLATMARPRSDEGRLQFRDTIFKYQDSSNMTVFGLTLHFLVPKEAQVKTIRSFTGFPSMPSDYSAYFYSENSHLENKSTGGLYSVPSLH